MTVQDAILIDKENDDTLWWDATQQQMKNVLPAL